MRRKRSSLLLSLLAVLVAHAATGLVSYDEGRRTIRGVQLLRDASDPTVYYYLPPFPRLATKDDGSLEFLCLKYVDAAGGASGGLFHALVELTLPPAELEAVEAELRRSEPGARIAGAVPLLQAVEDGAEGVGSFEVVSAVLGDTTEGGFTRTLVTSGRAPLMPGSKAVVAALLSEEGATLLWDSLNGPTSDVSIAVHAYYEAAVRSYNARVDAEVSTVYEHFSDVFNTQAGYTKTEIRDVTDELVREGVLDVQVLDRSGGLGIEESELAGMLDLVTDKLTELMFDSTAGWAVDPEREAAVAANQIRGRQERSWLARAFGNRDDTPYYTDVQHVLKRREDIRTNRFHLTLAEDTTVRVPVDTAGNLGGLYARMREEPRYFRIVNLDDPDFEFRTVYFQIDGGYLDAFQDTINFVSVNFRKLDGEDPDFTESLHFSSEEVGAGGTIQSVAFPRLGRNDSGWTDYEYQVRWSVRDRPTISVPEEPDQWLRGHDAAVSLNPPFERREIEIDADRELFAERGFSTAVLEVATVLGGKPQIRRRAVLRAVDPESIDHFSIYVDRDTPVGYRLVWNGSQGQIKGELEALESDYLFVEPPLPAETAR